MKHPPSMGGGSPCPTHSNRGCRSSRLSGDKLQKAMSRLRKPLRLGPPMAMDHQQVRPSCIFCPPPPCGWTIDSSCWRERRNGRRTDVKTCFSFPDDTSANVVLVEVRVFVERVRKLASTDNSEVVNFDVRRFLQVPVSSGVTSHSTPYFWRPV